MEYGVIIEGLRGTFEDRVRLVCLVLALALA